MFGWDLPVPSAVANFSHSSSSQPNFHTPMVKVALIGATGVLGPAVIAAAVLATFAGRITYPIKVVSRFARDSNPHVHYIQGDFTETPQAIAQQLKDCDVIVALTRSYAQVLCLLAEVVLAVRPSLYIPPLYGPENLKVQSYAPSFGEALEKHMLQLRGQGIQVAEICASLIAVPKLFLYNWVRCVGIDTKAETLVQRGSIDTEVSVTTVNDVARVIMAVATFPIPDQLPATILVELEKVSLRQIIERYQLTHHVRLKVTSFYSKEKALEQFVDLWSNGFSIASTPLYIQAIASQGPDKGLNFIHTHNELLNPNQQFWQWEKF